MLGVDIGTTSTKVVAFDAGGVLHGSESAGYDLSHPLPGRAEQHPGDILAAVRSTLAATVAQVGAGRVAGLSFSSAMHSLLGLDGAGRPVTPVVTWADSRATRQAEQLREGPAGLALHRRTGTPVHSMSPLTKLIWFREHEPALSARIAHWVGIKEYVLLQLCGELVTDHSVASGTGLLDLSRLTWDDEAMALAGVDPGRLPELVATTARLRSLRSAEAAALGVPASTPVIVGAGDGPLANLGLGAVRPGVLACSIGTSGALRVMLDRPAVDPLGQVFCYALTPQRWVVGGAVNAGGKMLDWAGAALAPDLGEHAEPELLRLAATVPAGSGGLIMLPYLYGERAPHWSSLPSGAYIGLRDSHGRAHLIRAAIEGVCQQLGLVLQSMRSAGLAIDEVRATGGFARSPLWRQILSDTLDLTVGYPQGHEGSGFGAALLGMQALEMVPSIDVAADLVAIADVVRPEPAAAARYAALAPVFAGLYQALVPTFGSLRDLVPGLPLLEDRA